MSTIHNERPRTRNGRWGVLLLGAIQMLTLVAAGLFNPESGNAQSSTAADTASAILGTVADDNSDPIPNATVVLQSPTGGQVTGTTIEDGTFVMHDVTPGIAYQIAIRADGFSEWSSSVSVDPGQQKRLGEIKLRVLASERTITVSYSSREVAVEQLKAEESQRVLGFIPNMFVTYEPHPEPLTAAMKFHLTYKGLTHPTFFAFQALWAGVQQSADMTDYRMGAPGYGERLGADLAGAVTEGLFANAILPSLLHQDPRYFYRGSGSKGSRAWHALSAPFICEGDNGKLQPNYSQWGGSLIAASLSNTYYPDSARGVGLTFTNFGTSMGLHVALGMAQEFLLPRFTSKGRH
jgi:hypothetical protein